MLVVHVHVSVQPDRVDDFLTATARNAQASLEEPGVLRFDVLQDQSDPAHVVLVLLVIPGSQLLIYPVLWILMPNEETDSTTDLATPVAAV